MVKNRVLPIFPAIFFIFGMIVQLISQFKFMEISWIYTALWIVFSMSAYALIYHWFMNEYRSEIK